MCGISGVWDPRCDDEGRLNRAIDAMTSALHHRGPDNGGRWTDREQGLALGHRRLAIVDLSPEGHQPMTSACGRFVIVYNGEIYNFEALRVELEALGRRFRGHSDTEVLLAAIEAFGIDSALERAAGMFAIALWDKRAKKLHLVRDRLGKKPLYYGWIDGAFVFASELKALRVHPGFDKDVNREALTAFLRYQYVPEPLSIWNGIFKVAPGMRLSLDRHDLREQPRGPLIGAMRPYWSIKRVVEERSRPADCATPELALDRLDARIRQAVKERMVADVPVGTFLSGGIDSSLVTAMMQAQSDTPVNSFTVGFDEGFYNEAASARQVASHLGTHHTEITVTGQDALDVVPELPAIYDEPFADPSAVPSVLISRLARRHVTVCLSGDGGDEIFSGYGRYALAANLIRRMGHLPHWMRRAAGKGVEAVPVGLWDTILRTMRLQTPDGLRGDWSGDRVHKLATLMAFPDADALYHAMISVNRHAARLVAGGAEPPSKLTDPHFRPRLADPVQRMMYFDSISYLPDDILVKMDRASMAVSLEVRSPLLDHRVLELAWEMPTSFLRRDGQGKWPLRALFDRYLPPHLRDRPKQGFGIPLADWLRGPLRDWAEDLLDPQQLAADGFLHPEPVRKLWEEHLSGTRNWGAQIWTIAMFQGWRRHWLSPASATEPAWATSTAA